MRKQRVAIAVVLLVALSAAGVVALRRPVRPPTSFKHGIATSLSAEPVGDDGDDGVGLDTVGLRPALDRAPRSDASLRQELARAVRLPARDPIPLRRSKLPSDDDDPFARG